MSVKLNPLLVGRLGDTISSNAGALDPSADSIDCPLGWSEHVDDFFRGEPLRIAIRVGVGTISRVSSVVGLAGDGYEHVVKERCALAIVDVGLRQSDAHGQLGIAVNLGALDPFLQRGSAFLVQHMVGGC